MNRVVFLFLPNLNMFMMIACYGFTFGKLRKLGNNLVSVISDPYFCFVLIFFFFFFGAFFNKL